MSEGTKNLFKRSMSNDLHGRHFFSRTSGPMALKPDMSHSVLKSYQDCSIYPKWVDIDYFYGKDKYGKNLEQS